MSWQGLQRSAADRRTIAGHAGHADLDAHVAEALRDIALRAVDDFREFGAVGVAVGVDGFAALAAGQLIDRHAGLAAFDVPQRLIDAADGVVQDRAVFPVRAVVAGLPDVLDAVGGLAEEERLQISLDGGLDQVGALGEGGAAVAVEAVLVGGDLDDGEAHAGRLAFDDADVFDAGRRHGARGACDLLLSCDQWRRSAEQTGAGDGLQEIAALQGHVRASWKRRAIFNPT